MPSLLRATRVAAAAPKSRIIGGAGTWVPPVELDDPPLDEEDEAELEAEEEAELLALEPELPDEPKLLEPPVAPLEFELLLADDEAEDEAEEDALLPELPLLPWLELPWPELP